MYHTLTKGKANIFNHVYRLLAYMGFKKAFKSYIKLFTKILIYDILLIAVEWHESSFTMGNYRCHLEY